MRGRRPKATRLKVLTGNPGRRPLNANEPRPEALSYRIAPSNSDRSLGGSGIDL